MADEEQVDNVPEGDGGGTKLTSAQLAEFNKWKGKLPTKLQSENDYDLKGLWLENPRAEPSSNLHFPDKYKLPNHPTFSDESIYFNDDTKKYAGHWNETDSSWNYTPYDPSVKKPVTEKKPTSTGDIANISNAVKTGVASNTPTAPGDDNIAAIYKAVSHDYDIGTPEQFKAILKDPKQRQTFFNGVGAEYELGSYKDFSKSIGEDPNVNPGNYMHPNGAAQTPNKESYYDKYGTPGQHQLQQPTSIPGLWNSDENKKSVVDLAKQEWEKKNGKNAWMYGNVPQPAPAGQPLFGGAEKQPYSDENAGQDADAFIGVTNPYSGTARKLFQHVTDTGNNEEHNKNIQKAYLNEDSQDWPEEERKKALANIDSGRYGYNLMLQKPTVRMNPFEAFIDNVENHYQAATKADMLMNSSPEERIAAENESIDKDEAEPAWAPIPESRSNVSKFTGAMGGMASGTEQAILGGMLAAYTGGASLATEASTTGNALGGLLMGQDATRATFGATYSQVYREQKKLGKSDEEADKEAMRQATVAGTSAGVSMAAMSAVGAAAIKTPMPGTVYNEGLPAFFKSIGQNVKVALKNTIPEATGVGTIAAVSKAAENVLTGKKVGDGVMDEFAQNALFVAGLHQLATLKGLLPRQREAMLTAYAGADPKTVEKGIQQNIAQGNLTEEQAAKLRDELAAQKALNEGLPDTDIPKERKQKIARLKAKRTALEDQLDPDSPNFQDEAFHPGIKEKINSVKKVNADGTTEGRDGINEKIRQLSQLTPEERAEKKAEFEKSIPKPPSEGLKIGDQVQWTSQGQDMFPEPKEITSMSEDGKYAFVEGTKTGIPTEQLSKPEIKVEPKTEPVTSETKTEPVTETKPAEPVVENKTAEPNDKEEGSLKPRKITSEAEEWLYNEDGLELEKPQLEKIAKENNIHFDDKTTEPEVYQALMDKKEGYPNKLVLDDKEPVKLEDYEPVQYRSKEETDKIMKQELPDESKKADVKLKMIDPETGKESVEKIPAREAYTSLRKQHKILDKVLKCL